MSIAATASSTPADPHAIRVDGLDEDFDRRWTAWKARGLVHERAAMRMFITAILAGTIATAAAIAYTVLSP